MLPGETGTFTVRVQNDGDATDEISIRGRRPKTGFSVEAAVGVTDVTSAFLAGTLTQSLAPGAQVDLTLHIKVASTTAVGSIERELVTATSGNDVTVQDVVRARVRVTG